MCARAYHALFMWNMLIRPTPEALESFGSPDYVIFNAGRFPANRYTTGMTSTTSIDISFEASCRRPAATWFATPACSRRALACGRAWSHSRRPLSPNRRPPQPIGRLHARR